MADQSKGDVMINDRQRPAYHFLPAANWMNDPNGLIHWRGVFHLFYQYNPHGAFHATMHWGHATSRDLVYWQHEPIALAPTPGGPDQDGVWSGCAVDDHGVPTLVYTGVRGTAQLPCVAVSHDALHTWVKDADNPVIAAPPAEYATNEFRDHTIWLQDGMWYMGIGSTIRDEVGCVALYRSHDLRRWEYLGPLVRGDPSLGTIWECPDFFALAGRHILIVSPLPFRRVIYLSGRYADHRFEAEFSGEVDPGGSFYAPQSFVDAAGRRIMLGWLAEERSVAAQRAAGWSGAMSLPRLLSMRPDGTLVQTPAPELQQLRREHWYVTGLAIEAGARAPLAAAGDQIELRANIDVRHAEQAGFAVRRSPDGAEETLIFYDRTSGMLVVDRKQSSLDAESPTTRRTAVLALAAHEPLALTIFIDHSVIEITANDRVFMAVRVYPALATSTTICPIAAGGDAWLTTCDAWQMASIWPAE